MPPLTRDFLLELKRATEDYWSVHELDPNAYGGQFVKGTRWNSGLSDGEISEYENVLGLRFPADFRHFLSVMNGTDRPTLNIYGSSGIRPRESFGVYSYPRDMARIRERINWVRADRLEIEKELAEQGFDLASTAGLVPVYAHRYVICTDDPRSSVVLSIEGTDAIVYADSLREYLEREFLEGELGWRSS